MLVLLKFNKYQYNKQEFCYLVESVDLDAWNLKPNNTLLYNN
jgi:hypothetical protein